MGSDSTFRVVHIGRLQELLKPRLPPRSKEEETFSRFPPSSYVSAVPLFLTSCRQPTQCDLVPVNKDKLFTILKSVLDIEGVAHWQPRSLI